MSSSEDSSSSDSDRGAGDGSDFESEDNRRSLSSGEASDEENHDQDRGCDAADIEDGNLDITNLHLCPTHQAGSMTRECAKCSASLGVITNNALIEKLTAGAGESGLRARYAGRCDQVKPTIELSDSVVNLAQDMITQGQFKAKNAWTDVVKNFLTLPSPQHDKLSKDIELEAVFDKFRSDKRYKNLFKYHREARNALKDLRLSQRPLLSIIEKINAVLISLRRLGEDAGLGFPSDPPARTGKFVPRDTRTVLNQLHLESTSSLFPPPDFSGLAEKYGLGDDCVRDIERITDEYRQEVGGKYVKLYETVAASYNDLDDLLIFYTVSSL